jgi:hypothetical protein
MMSGVPPSTRGSHTQKHANYLLIVILIVASGFINFISDGAGK